MKKLILIVGILSAALVGGLGFLSPQAIASNNGDSPRWGRGQCREWSGERLLGRMTEVLDLSAEQQEKIKAVIDEHREKVAPLRQSLGESRDQLRQASRAEAFDEAAVRSLAENQAAIRTELMVERARMRSRINALLTLEQRQLAEEKLERRREHRAERHHGKRGERPEF